jgi:pilus assembly protein CpaB
MKPKTMILMVVAIVCGLGASYMTSRLLAEREEQPTVVQVAPPVEKVTLVVAKKPLPIGQMIKNAKNLFVEKSFVKEDAPKDCIGDWKSLEGKVLKRSLRTGDHVFADDISDRPQTLEVPPGMRALGLPVNLASIASGFASLPGSRVDIIWNYRGPNPTQTFAMKLLQNVLVLAADTQDGTPETRALPASVVTVAVTPEDAERVGLAMENGTFRLVLRRPDDNSFSHKTYTTLADVLTPPRRPEEMPPDEKIGEEPVKPAEKVAETKPEELPAEKWESIPAPQVRKHVVTIREGDRVRYETYELDDDFDEPQTGKQPTRGGPGGQNPGPAELDPRVQSGGTQPVVASYQRPAASPRRER